MLLIKSIFKKILIFILGLIVVLILLEISLRISGYYVQHKFSSKKYKKNHNTILCIGDSFTFGEGGSEGHDYPKQLENILNSFTNDSFKVINAGQGGQNSTQILNRIESEINNVNPSVAILMFGMANYWNYYGFKSKTNNFLYKIKVYKFFKLLYQKSDYKIWLWKRERIFQNYIKSKYKEAVNALAIAPKSGVSYHKMGSYFILIKDYYSAIKWFEKGIKIQPDLIENYRGIIFSYKLIEKKEGNNTNKLDKWFNNQINNNKNNSVLNLVYILNSLENRNIKNAVNNIVAQISNNKVNNFDYVYSGIVFSNLKRIPEVKDYIQNIINQPKNLNNDTLGYYYSFLADLCVEESKIMDGLEWLHKSMKFKYSPEYNSFILQKIQSCPQKINIIEDNVIKEIRALKIETDMFKNLQSFINKINTYYTVNDYCFPSLTYLSVDDKEIIPWITNDIEDAILICKRNGVKIILQNYPLSPNNLPSVAWAKNTGAILKQIALKYKLPFVDNVNKFELLGENKKKYFEPVGIGEHPNDKGYELMAKNIFIKIIESNIFKLDSSKVNNYQKKINLTDN